MFNNVLQDWVSDNLTLKMQTVLLCALRGPDANGSPDLKAWTRWIRSIVLKNAAPNKTFMRQDSFVGIDVIAQRMPLALDLLPVHYFSHLMHALQVIGYEHPDPGIAVTARVAYYQLADYLHLLPESKDMMHLRLSDELVADHPAWLAASGHTA